MNLTPAQKETVASWVAAGDSLSVVQKKLVEQFQVSMTYRDVRFLVDDLDLQLKDAAPKADTDLSKAPAPPAPPAEAPAKRGLMDRLKEKVGLGGDETADDLPPEGADFDDEPGLPPASAQSDSALSGFKLDIDRVVQPGTMASGKVTFSDGVSGRWALDQYGRLMLDTGQPGYQPSPADVQTFQRELSTQLQRAGY